MDKDKALNREHRMMVNQLSKPANDIIEHLIKYPDQAHAWHMATGIAGEAGELLDAIKKHVVYAKHPNVKNIIEELGDLEFYMEGIRAHFGITREMTLDANMQKLLKGKNARYSSGTYSDSAAQLRTDKFTVPEREVIEFVAQNHSTVFYANQGNYAFSIGDLSDYCYYIDTKNRYRQSASMTNFDLLCHVKPEWIKE